MASIENQIDIPESQNIFLDPAYSVSGTWRISTSQVNLFSASNQALRERSGSVVECLTRDQEAAGSSLTGVTAFWSLSKTHLS